MWKGPVPLHFCLHGLEWEIHSQLNCFSPIGITFFFFGCFENSLCVLFSAAWLWYVRAWISLSSFSLGFAELLDSIGLCIFPNLGSLSQYFFIIALFPLILMTQTLELLCWPTGPWGSAHFSNLYLCSSDWVFAMDLSLSSLTLFFFIISILLLSWSVKFCYFNVLFFRAFTFIF